MYLIYRWLARRKVRFVFTWHLLLLRNKLKSKFMHANRLGAKSRPLSIAGLNGSEGDFQMAWLHYSFHGTYGVHVLLCHVRLRHMHIPFLLFLSRCCVYVDIVRNTYPLCVIHDSFATWTDSHTTWRILRNISKMLFQNVI